MESPRPLDRLDHRLAARRLRGRHVRAVARALAERHGREGGRRPRRALSCRTVYVARGRRVSFADPRDHVSTGEVAELVAELRAQGVPRRAEQLAAAYARLADDYGLYRSLEKLAAEPLVIATGGRVGTGKSTLAKSVARRLAAPRVLADRVRRGLLARVPDGWAHELAWEPELGERIYAGLFARAADVLAARRSVVLDACFPSRARRAGASTLAARFGAHFVFVHCEAPAADVAARLRLRDLRDGVEPGTWAALAAALDAHWEPPGADEPGRMLRIDTSESRGTWLRALGLGGSEAG